MDCIRKIYRHDLRCSSSKEQLLNMLRQDQREVFVWLFFGHHDTIEDALLFVLSDERMATLSRADWRDIDAYSLDNSKTFVNGRCWL